MDTIDASLQQLQELFQNIMATLRGEKEQLHVAIQCFELVCTVICGCILCLETTGEAAGCYQQCAADRTGEG